MDHLIARSRGRLPGSPGNFSRKSPQHAHATTCTVRFGHAEVAKRGSGMALLKELLATGRQAAGIQVGDSLDKV